jgi:hypothetical protein
MWTKIWVTQFLWFSIFLFCNLNILNLWNERKTTLAAFILIGLYFLELIFHPGFFCPVQWSPKPSGLCRSFWQLYSNITNTQLLIGTWIFCLGIPRSFTLYQITTIHFRSYGFDLIHSFNIKTISITDSWSNGLDQLLCGIVTAENPDAINSIKFHTNLLGSRTCNNSSPPPWCTVTLLKSWQIFD